MSTPTTSDPPSTSLGQSSSQASSLNKRHKNFVPRSTSDPTSPTRTPLLLLLPSKSWIESNFNSQTLSRSQWPCMHYRPWCDDCQTLMGWEPPQPIRPQSTKSILLFGDLKTVVQVRSCFQSPFVTQISIQSAIRKICSEWRDEQFTRAVAKRNGQRAAQEARRWQVHWQRMDHGVRP